jgi:hypothetical protein
VSPSPQILQRTKRLRPKRLRIFKAYFRLFIDL